MNYFFEYLAASFLTFLANILPIEAAAWLARRLGDLSYLLLWNRRRIALENVGKAFGPSLSKSRMRQIVRSAFQNAALSIMELFIVRKIKKDLARRFEFHGDEKLRAALARGKGVVLAISHLGSWEYLSFLSGLTGRPWSVIVKDIKNPYLNKVITELRLVMGVVPVPKSNSVRTIFQELKKGNGIAMLIDQWAGSDGIWVDFFGTPTSTTSVPARLAEKTGCAIVPAYCLRKKPGWYSVHVEDPIDLNTTESGWEKTATQKLNAMLEKQIRQHPEQWLWGHRRWKNKPDNLRVLG